MNVQKAMVIFGWVWECYELILMSYHHYLFPQQQKKTNAHRQALSMRASSGMDVESSYVFLWKV